jgi:hypothetical protein
MPIPKHDLDELVAPGLTLSQKLVYFEPMFLGLWLMVTSNWAEEHLALCFYKIFGLGCSWDFGSLAYDVWL